MTHRAARRRGELLYILVDMGGDVAWCDLVAELKAEFEAASKSWYLARRWLEARGLVAMMGARVTVTEAGRHEQQGGM